MYRQPLLPLVISVLIAGAGVWGPTLSARAAVPGAPARPGATIVVDTSADETTNDGNCSLREAIQAANTDQQVDSCAAGQGEDTIELPAGTYTLALAGANEDGNATGDLDILSDLALVGESPETTIIDGNQLDRVLHVHADVTGLIRGVTIRNGRTPKGPDDQNGGGDGGDGGGLLNEGGLQLLECAVVDNRTGQGGGYVHEPYNSKGGGRGGRGGGIASTGALEIGFGVVADNLAGDGGDGGAQSVAGCCRGGDGGGIFSSGQLTITHSSVRDNQAGAGNFILSPPFWSGQGGGTGGGVANEGLATIIASTISGNRSGQGASGGGFHSVGGIGGAGGGIANYGAALLTLVNSTVSGNHAGDGGSTDGYGGDGGDGGGVYNVGPFAASDVTVRGNLAGGGGTGIYGSPGSAGSGGGIFNQDSAELRNTILAGNRAGGAGSDCQNTLTSKGYNLVQSLAGCVLAGDTTGNITGADPRLGPLADNGGPTWTHALLAFSPAIDAGSCTGLDGNPVTQDQRDAARPQGAGCDMGAYEATPFVYLYLHLPLVLR
jgi:CSLREA domain-containing protein